MEFNLALDTGGYVRLRISRLLGVKKEPPWRLNA